MSSQSKKLSLIETITGTAIKYWFNILIQLIIYPYFGARFTFDQNIKIGLVFLVSSIVIGYGVRRGFNWFQRKSELDRYLKPRSSPEAGTTALANRVNTDIMRLG